MDLNLEEKQNEQAPKEGPLSQGLNALNNFRGVKSLSGKAGSRAAAQAGRLAAQAGSRFIAFFATPPGWITLAIIAVVVVTFVIVISLGAPPMQTDNAQTTLPIPTPTPPAAL